MAVLVVEPEVLGANEASLNALLENVAGEPVLVVARGNWENLDAPSASTGAQSLPAIVIGVGRGSVLSKICDLWTESDVQAKAWQAGFEQSPVAAWTAAMLLRDQPVSVWGGIVNESTAYSTLLSGEYFKKWRADNPKRTSEIESENLVEVEVRAGIRIITLNRPLRHNAITPELRDSLYAALAQALLEAEPVVLRGHGPSFCSGGDLDTFGSAPDPAWAHIIRTTQSLAWITHLLAPRLVVALHGACLGAGVEIPLFAHQVIAADNTRIGLPELQFGLIPGAGGTVSISQRAGAHRVLELLLDGTAIDADKARSWGLVEEVVPESDLENRVIRIAEAKK